MNGTNWKVVASFFGSLILFVCTWGGIDALIGYKWGSAATVSWSVALLAREYPLLAAIFYFNTGGLFYGLMVHFHNPMIDVKDWEKMEEMQKRIDELEGRSPH